MTIDDRNALTIQAGPAALAQLRRYGLRAQDIAAVAGAAGGPKGLILQALDQWLFGDFLARAPRHRTLIGASIGAWRMAAACDPDPVTAFKRLGDLYCEQRYGRKPSPQVVSGVCLEILQKFIGKNADAIVNHPHHHLQILVSRGRARLQMPTHRVGTLAGFAAATLANLVARDRLAGHLDRIVVGDPRDALGWMKAPFDAFDTRFAPLQSDNLITALLASGTLPFVMAPVTAIPRAPLGTFWDGGLIDYHLSLPYSRITDGLVLYPHFTDHLVPGWLDKALRWRRAGRGNNRTWLDNVILLSPSRSFLDRLPRRKLPDRGDFLHYGLDHAARIRNWQTAISEGQRLRDALMQFVAAPDMATVQPIY